jgi:hypothetical protein
VRVVVQEHIAKQKEIYGNESSREATKARRDWDKKLAAAKYRYTYEQVICDLCFRA